MRRPLKRDGTAACMGLRGGAATSQDPCATKVMHWLLIDSTVPRALLLQQIQLSFDTVEVVSCNPTNIGSGLLTT